MSSPGLRFFLSYAENAGGLTEHRPDSTLLVLPPSVAHELEVPEEVTVTIDADVAREDDCLLLAAGHPVLAKAADLVLSAGDVGVATYARPGSFPPDGATLLEKARDQFPVDHGRIDASGGSAPALRPVLRVGALATYATSASDHYQERIDCWIDIESRLPLPASVVERLSRQSLTSQLAELPDSRVLHAAVSAAHEHLDTLARDRSAALIGLARQDFQQELERAKTYYADQITSLRKRSATAPEERIKTLEARIKSTEQERERRLAEIAEKFTPRHEFRPYRLQVLMVPSLRLPVDVRRGD